MNRTAEVDDAMQAQRDSEQAGSPSDDLARPIRRLTDTRLDLPGPVPLRKSYIVASTDRSGSTFLCSMLWRTGVLGAPAEYWNFRDRPGARPIGTRMMKRLGASSPADYLNKLLAVRTTKNGVFGVKVHSFDFEEMLRRFPNVLDELSPVTYVHIQRRDKVAQAVSLAKATQTGAWVAQAKAKTGSLHYDRDLIARCLGFLERQDRDWGRWFETNHIDPFVVIYENLTADPTSVVRAILELLGVQNDERQEVQPPALERQADETNEEWVARFRRDSGLGARSPQADASATVEVAADQPPTELGLVDRAEPVHVFDRYDEIKDAAARPIEAKRLRHRYEAIVGRNRGLFQNARVLQIHSGDGRWTLAALDAGAGHVVGIENEQAQIEAAKSALAKLGISADDYEFVNAEIIAALRSFPAGSFDLVLCQEFSKLPDPHLFFQRLRRLQPQHIILDTGIIAGKVPMLSFRLKDQNKAQSATGPSDAIRAIPNHELIRILCDYFDFRWRVIDWHAFGIADWTGIHDYERERRRTYVLDRLS